MEVHESMSNELGQDACDERDFPRIPDVDVVRLAVHVKAQLDHRVEDFVTEVRQRRVHSIEG